VERLREVGYTGYTIDHAPEVTRSVAYGKTRGIGDFLRPLAPGEPLDAWPHQVWCAPGAGLG
ncbi:MAG: hypothetical protein JO040_04680, partial [Gemmatimonadetes bacterium]|nr:hypothetical protein [Gemmatimonadota bacterium]